MELQNNKNKSDEKSKTVENQYSGIPMTEEEYLDWQKVFQDIEESIDNL